MKRMDVLQQDGRRFTVEMVEESRGTELSRDTIQAFHIGATMLACLFALLAALAHLDAIGYGLSALFAVFCLIGMILGRTIAKPLGDLYRQFHYREKLLLFIIHVTVVFVPWFLGIRDLVFGFALLLVVLCFQAIDAIFYGRIYAVAAVLVLLACIHRSEPPIILLLGWLFFTILAFRFGHIHFQLKDFGEERHGVEMQETFRRGILLAAVPTVIMLLAYLISDASLVRREIVYDAGIMQQDGSTVFLSVGRMLFQAFFLVLLIVVCIALLHWLDKYLVSRRKATPPEVEATDATMRRYTMEHPHPEPLVEAPATGPREKIIHGFRDLSQKMQVLGLARLEQETAADYLARLAGIPEDSESLRIFDKACYGQEDPAEEEAKLFEKAREEIEKELRGRQQPGS